MSAKEPSPETKNATVAYLTVVPPSEAALQDRVERVRVYHEGCEKAAQSQIGYAFLCGLELNQAKEEIPHGQFGKWREQFLPQIPARTAQVYMLFSKDVQAKSKAIATLMSQPLQLTNGELSEEDRKIILKAVHDFADGATLTELYREYGILRKPKHQSERERGKPMTPAERAAAEEQLVQDHIDSLIADLNLITPEFLGKAKAAARNELRDACIEKSKLIAALSKSRK